MKPTFVCEGFKRPRAQRPIYPPADKGLFHGVRPKKIWKVIPPKLPGWNPTVHRIWRMPAVKTVTWHFPSLKKRYVIDTTTTAIRAIDLAGGIEPYVLRTRIDKLGILGTKLRVAVKEVRDRLQAEHSERTKADYLAAHPSASTSALVLQPDPVLVWSWLQDAEANDLTRSCIRCGQTGHPYDQCNQLKTIDGGVCDPQPLHDVHSLDERPSWGTIICPSYHQLGECQGHERCDTERVGACPMCGETGHAAYEHIVASLQQRGVDIDLRPTPIPITSDAEQPLSPAEDIHRALEREEARMSQICRLARSDELTAAARTRWEAAGRPDLPLSADDQGETSDAPVSRVAVATSASMYRSLAHERERRHRNHMLRGHLDRPAVTVAPC